MKNLIIMSFLAVGLTSCAKDSIDNSSDEFISIEKSEIYVKVSYLSWEDSNCEPGCVLNVNQISTNISNAEVKLYAGEHLNNDQSSSPVQLAFTDQNGSVLFAGLEPSQYTLVVDTPYGIKSRTIYTQLHRRSSIDFSF